MMMTYRAVVNDKAHSFRSRNLHQSHLLPVFYTYYLSMLHLGYGYII